MHKIFSDGKGGEKCACSPSKPGPAASHFACLPRVCNRTLWTHNPAGMADPRRSENLLPCSTSLKLLFPIARLAAMADDDDRKLLQENISRKHCSFITLPTFSSTAIFTCPPPLLCFPFKVFWSETIFYISRPPSVCIKVRTLLGMLAIGICYLFFSGAKEEAAVWLKKTLIQFGIASLCFPVTLSSSIRTQWKWYRSKALLASLRTKRSP